jgi:predicted RNA binding protein YcfA (HicA-like mRNA interferase family)
MRQRSSHVTLRHPGTARSVTVTDHGSRDLPAGTLHGILTDAGLTAEEFRRLLR